MGGSMIQLLAYGAQDVYLTGNPQVTFFQAVYKRNTNFAMEFYKNQINDTASNGTTLRITVTRYGDLVGQMFFELPLKASLVGDYTSDNSTADLNWVAERAFSSVELQIGNNTIDKHYQTWWRLYTELFMHDTQKAQYAKMTTYVGQSSGEPKVYLPLNFFFNRNQGLFLPLIALAYHEIQLVCTCAPDYNTYFDNTKRPTLWVNYVLLDSEERRRFAAKQHEYLIEQVQYSPDTVPSAGGRIRVKLQHPVKELIWCYPNLSGTNKLWDFTANANFVNLTCDPQLTGIHQNHVGTPRLLSNATPWVEDGDILAAGVAKTSVGPLKTMTMYFNGQERFVHDHKFLNQVQPFYHHTGTPYPGIYVYSFALKPEDHQPTGTCNFSRLDNVEMVPQLKTFPASITNYNTSQYLFAVNYNVLRIKSGMAGVAFA